MIIKPKSGGTSVFPSAPERGLFVQCAVVSPRSARGRSATLWIPPDRTEEMFMALRDYRRTQQQRFQDLLNQSLGES